MSKLRNTSDMENYEEKYKKGLSFLKDLKPHMSDYCKEKLEGFFPELNESEDERIRKELYKYFRDLQLSSDSEFSPSISIDEILAWLEKQGKIVDEYEDKLDRCACESFDKGYKTALEKQGEQKFPSLSKEEIVCLKRTLDFLREEHNSYTGKDFTNEIGVLEWLITHPVLIYFPELQQNQGEQKPIEWSEEDDAMIEETLYFLNEYQKSNRCNDENDMQNSVTCEYWLKSLKDKAQPQSHQEWSEDDEKMLNGVILDLTRLRNKDTGEEGKAAYQREIDWVKSIKPNHWKPSEEHFRALFYAIEYFKKKKNDTKYLESLYDGLKQL